MLDARPDIIAPEWAQLGLTPGTVLRAFGMRRSGNHAIIDWLLRNAPSGKSVFLNNCTPRHSPLGSFRSIAVNGDQVAARPALKDLAGCTGAAGEGAMLVFSYEDTSPAELQPGRRISGDFDERRIDSELVLYRSFLNWSASLVRKLQDNPGYSLSRRAAIVMRAIDTYCRILGLVEDKRDLGIVAVCYDDWLSSESYRAGLLAQLGLATRDNALGQVQSYGGGSSFQKDATQAADLATDRRWQQMIEDPEYCAILSLAAQDAALTDRLARVFPSDAARLASLARDLTGHSP